MDQYHKTNRWIFTGIGVLLLVIIFCSVYLEYIDSRSFDICLSMGNAPADCFAAIY